MDQPGDFTALRWGAQGPGVWPKKGETVISKHPKSTRGERGCCRADVPISVAVRAGYLFNANQGVI